MRYTLTDYALKRVQQRGVTREMVDKVLRNPDQNLPGNERGRRVYQSKMEVRGRLLLLRVVVEVRPEVTRVITLYLTNQIERYWSSEPGLEGQS